MSNLEEAIKKYINDLPFGKAFDDTDIKKAIEFGVQWQQVNQRISDDDEIIIGGRIFRRGDIYDIYDIERDKTMFFNREAGYIVQLIRKNDTDKCIYKFGVNIAYESYSWEIASIKGEWEKKMKEAIKLWKGEFKKTEL